MGNMQNIGVIPARWASTRFEGKVLADIDGKSMIQHVWGRAKQARLLNDVFVACDDQRVFDHVNAFGGKAVMTSADHSCGTDRIAEVCKNIDAEIVVNIQGDEPLIEAQVIDKLCESLMADESCPMATVVKLLDDPNELENPNVVKVVIDQNQNALYFSRSVIPYARDKDKKQEIKYFKHFGLYAYRKDFLMQYHDLPSSPLEKTEQLEQLRALQAGYKIKTIQTELDSIGVDTPEDLKRVKQYLQK